MDPITFIILFLAIVILPIAFLFVYFRDLIFGPAVPARIKRDIKPKPEDIIDFMNSSENPINIVAGEMDPEGYTSRALDALDAAWERGIKISVVAGPIILYNEDTFGKMKKLIQGGRVDFYVSLTRQPQHFYVDGGGKLFFEEKHDPGSSTRTVVVFPYNKFEARWYRKEFSNILKSNNVKKFSPNNSENIIFIKKDQMELLKNKITASKKKFGEYSIQDFKDLMHKQNIEYFLWSQLCQLQDT